MPLLTRVVGTPLTIDIGAGTVAGLAPLLADRRISSGGHVAVVVGPGLGEEIAESLRGTLDNAEVWHTEAGGVEDATRLARRLREGFYDALVGIGGGRTLDVAKYAASLSGLPMVAVATSLAHDGLASPVASLEDHGRKGSYGVQMPIAVMVDLDYVRRSDPALRRGGVGDVISNLSAIADWRLAERVRGEAVDGVAVTFARTAATSIVHREDGIDDDEFLIALAEALVLSGLAMATAGSSRPCSGGDHEILHAIDHLFPGTAGHGELAGAASLFTAYLRDEPGLAAGLSACLARHGLPRTPADLGLTEQQFAQAVVHAPLTRPDRYTILEHLELDDAAALERVRAFAEAYGSTMPSIAELRVRTQPDSIFARNSGEHWAGKLYMRRLSPYLTRLLIGTRLTPNGVTWLMIAVGLAAAAVLTLPGLWPAVAVVVLIQLQLLLDCSDGELARWRGVSSPAGIYLDRLAHNLTEAALPVALAIRADGGWDSIGNWTDLGLLTAMLVLLVRVESALVYVARAEAGLPVVEDTAAVAAPRQAGLARLRRLLSFAPFFRAFVAIEFSFLALAAAIGDEIAGGLEVTRVLVTVLVPVAALIAVGRLAAILSSQRLR